MKSPAGCGGAAVNFMNKRPPKSRLRRNTPRLHWTEYASPLKSVAAA
jgi:hypothetical protein